MPRETITESFVEINDIEEIYETMRIITMDVKFTYSLTRQINDPESIIHGEIITSNRTDHVMLDYNKQKKLFNVTMLLKEIDYIEDIYEAVRNHPKFRLIHLLE
jgi:hypothetical protein